MKHTIYNEPILLFKKFLKTLENQNLASFFLDELDNINQSLSLSLNDVELIEKQPPKLVYNYLSKFQGGSNSKSPLNISFFEIANKLDWYQIFDSDKIESSLAKGLFAAQIIGTRGVIKSPNFYMGLFLLSPEVHYPLHQHNPLEIYYVCSGKLKLQHGRKKVPFEINEGEFSITPSNQVHSLTTGQEPCLLSYMWVPGTVGLHGPNWWWEEQEDGSWKRICWERQSSSNWVITGSEDLTQEIIDSSGDN